MKTVPKKIIDIEASLEEEEKVIFHLLKQESKSTDELVGQTEFSVEKVLSILSILEIKGVVEKNIEGNFSLRDL